MVTLRLLSCASLVFLAACAPAQDKAVRLDAHGDPLPNGALARLGTLRFRTDQPPGACALSPDGKLLAVGSWGTRPVRLLDAKTGKEVRPMQGEKTGSSWLAFSPDGKMLASAYHGSEISLWDAETGKQLWVPGAGRIRRTSPFAFSGDAKRLATNEHVGKSRKITVWDVENGKEVSQVEPLQNWSVQAALSRNGKLLATWGKYFQGGNSEEVREGSRTVQLWDAATGKELRKLKLDAPAGDALFAPDGKTLVTCGDDSAILVWDLATGKELRRFAGRRGVGYEFVFSPDGKTLAASAHNGAVQLWDYATGRRLGVHEVPSGRALRLQFAPDGKLLGWTSNGEAIAIWDVRAEKLLTPAGGHEARVNSVAFSATGQVLYSGDIDRVICQWDLASGKEITKRQMRDDEMRGGKGRLEQGGILSPDGKYVLTASQYGFPLWDLTTGREVCTFTHGYDYNPMGLIGVFSPDGSRLAMRERNRRARGVCVGVVEVHTGRKLTQLDVGLVEVSGLAFSADGKSVAAITSVHPRGGPHEVGLWDVADGKRRWQMSRTDCSEEGLAFSPDGLTLAFVERGNSITLVTTAAGGELRRLTPRDAAIRTYRPLFSPDGRTLAAAGTHPDGGVSRVMIWELSTGTIRQELIGHQGPIRSLPFSPDGGWLATGSSDTTVLLWDLAGRGAEATVRPTAKELEELWAALDSADGREGFRALSRLLAVPADAVALVKKNLEPVKGQGADGMKIAQLVEDLGHQRFNKRDEARKQLEALGRAAEAELMKGLADNPSPEKKKRMQELLDKLRIVGIKLELIRSLRAIEVLERIGTPEARQVLETLAGGAPEAKLTREAKPALERTVKASKPTS